MVLEGPGKVLDFFCQ